MPYDITDGAQTHRLQLEGREKLTVSGVEDVERFDDTCIVLSTCVGTLVVSGEALHIGKLSLDGGELHVDGRIDAVTYEDAPEAGGGGFFARLFGGYGRGGVRPAGGVSHRRRAGTGRRSVVRPAAGGAAAPPEKPAADPRAGRPVRGGAGSDGPVVRPACGAGRAAAVHAVGHGPGRTGVRPGAEPAVSAAVGLLAVGGGGDGAPAADAAALGDPHGKKRCGGGEKSLSFSEKVRYDKKRTFRRGGERTWHGRRKQKNAPTRRCCWC